MAQQSGRSAAQSLCRVHSSSVSRADVYTAVTLPPMFDIFDVPPRLARKAALPSQHQMQQSTSSLSRCTPTPAITSLPSPVVFEGPARRRAVLRHHEAVSLYAYAPRYGSAPVITMFDERAHSGGRPVMPLLAGPHPQMSNSTSPSASRNILQLAIGAGAATAATFAVAQVLRPRQPSPWRIHGVCPMALRQIRLLTSKSTDPDTSILILA
ncbi:hypothetical protein K438DRAFT_1959932 [Mycena galopus ATCC 62051]|nr:hypothetical protein K438DRAFT_1959932 [Mycena galopus ATCC 62051]